MGSGAAPSVDLNEGKHRDHSLDDGAEVFDVDSSQGFRSGAILSPTRAHLIDVILRMGHPHKSAVFRPHYPVRHPHDDDSDAVFCSEFGPLSFRLKTSLLMLPGVELGEVGNSGKTTCALALGCQLGEVLPILSKDGARRFFEWASGVVWRWRFTVWSHIHNNVNVKGIVVHGFYDSLQG